jgi:hypothetical protein
MSPELAYMWALTLQPSPSLSLYCKGPQEHNAGQWSDMWSCSLNSFTQESIVHESQSKYNLRTRGRLWAGVLCSTLHHGPGLPLGHPSEVCKWWFHPSKYTLSGIFHGLAPMHMWCHKTICMTQEWLFLRKPPPPTAHVLLPWQTFLSYPYQGSFQNSSQESLSWTKVSRGY